MELHDLIERAPKGIVARVAEPAGPRITCASGTPAIRVFLVVYAAFALLGFFAWLHEKPSSAGQSGFGLAVVAILLLAAVFGLLWCFVGRTDFVLAADALTVEKRLLAWHRTRVFP